MWPDGSLRTTAAGLPRAASLPGATILPSLLSAAGVLVGALAGGLYFARFALDSYDAQIMFVVARSIATTHTAYVPAAADAFGRNSPHASYGVGQSLAEVPAYLAAVASRHDPQTLAMLVNPVLFALVAIAVWAWARVAGATALQAALVGLATALGTMLLAYTPTGGSEIGTALGVAIAILGVELARRRAVPGGLVAAAGVTVAVLFRPDSAVVVAVPVGVAVLLLSRPGVLVFGLGMVPAAVTTLLYNGGHGAQYAGVPLSQSFSHPLGIGVYGLLLSPGRGLVFYVPLVVVALAAVPWAWRRSAVVTGLCLALLGVRVVFYAMWYQWQGGWAWGPRFLVPAMPCLAPLLYEVVRRISLSWRGLSLAAAAGAVLALSISVQVLGASVRYDTDTANLTMTAVWRSDYNSGPQDGVMLDWRYFPIVEHLRELHHGRNLARGYRGGVGLPFN